MLKWVTIKLTVLMRLHSGAKMTPYTAVYCKQRTSHGGTLPVDLSGRGFFMFLSVNILDALTWVIQLQDEFKQHIFMYLRKMKL